MKKSITVCQNRPNLTARALFVICTRFNFKQLIFQTILCKGNNVSIFSKTTELQKPVRLVQFVIFEKFPSAYYTKLQEKSSSSLLLK